MGCRTAWAGPTSTLWPAPTVPETSKSFAVAITLAAIVLALRCTMLMDTRPDGTMNCNFPLRRAYGTEVGSCRRTGGSGWDDRAPNASPMRR